MLNPSTSHNYITTSNPLNLDFPSSPSFSSSCNQALHPTSQLPSGICNKMADTEAVHHHRHHDPTNYGMVSAPHGPETGDDHVHVNLNGVFATEAESEADIFQDALHPRDMYTPEGVYWADLPFWEQVKFNHGIDAEESKKELGQIWAMMKRDPLSPIAWYFKNAVLPGAGLGLEG